MILLALTHVFVLFCQIDFGAGWVEFIVMRMRPQHHCVSKQHWAESGWHELLTPLAINKLIHKYEQGTHKYITKKLTNCVFD
jgi:hypothetical protein